MPLASIDDLIASSADYGVLARALVQKIASTTAANITSGYVNAQRMPRTFTVPSMTTVARAYMTMCDLMSGPTNATILMAGLEVELGSLAISTGTFTDGSAMPSRRVLNAGTSALQLASMMPMLAVNAALTATTPVITVTYTNQDGTGSRSASLTLPTSPVIDSAYLMTPHLQSGDTGIRDISNMTKSAGTAGTLKCYGFVPVAIACQGTAYAMASFPPLGVPLPSVGFEANDIIAFYRFGSAAAADFVSAFALTGET